jgi:hypothetical protein
VTGCYTIAKGQRSVQPSPWHDRPNPINAADAAIQRRVDEVEFGVMPSYADNPDGWNRRIRARIAGLCRARGILDNTVINAIAREIDCDVAVDHKQGNERYYLARLARKIRVHRRQQKIDESRTKAKYEMRRLAKNAQAAGLLGIDYNKILTDFIASRDEPNYIEAEARINALIQEKTMTAAQHAKDTENGEFVSPSQQQGLDELTTAFGPKSEPSTPTHEMDISKAPYAFTNHLKRVHHMDDKLAGMTCRNIFSLDNFTAIEKYGVTKCWEMIEAFDAAHPYQAEPDKSTGDPYLDSILGNPPAQATVCDPSGKRVPDEYDAKYPPSSTNKGQAAIKGNPLPDAPNAPVAPPVVNVPNGKKMATRKNTEPVTKPSDPITETALTVIQPSQVAIIRETAFTGRALLPNKIEWEVQNELAVTGFKSGLLKDIKNEFAAKFIVETGRELGIPPSLALRRMYLVHGQIAMAAELMWALVLNSGKLENFSIEEFDDHCTVMVQRKGTQKPYTTTFTLDMARKIATSEYDGQGNKKTIPLSDKYNWKAMPSVMCKWRALSAACRTIFPDVTLGLYSREEMDDNIDFKSSVEAA